MILVAFDELPINSLLDAHGRIDAARFPNFARLARGSTWFEHATTVGEGTTHAIPAILTGRFPKAGEFPVYTDHRQNIFTLFGGAHAPPRGRPGDAPLPALALPGPRGLALPPIGDARRGHGRRLPARTAPGRPHRRDPVDCERLGQLPAGREQAQRPRPIDPAFLDSLRPGAAARASGTCTCCCPTARGRTCPPASATTIRPAPGWGSDEVWNAEPGRGRPVLAAAPAAARLRRPGARPAARPPPREPGLYDRARARRHRRPRRQLPRRAEAPAAVGRRTARTSPTCRCS